MSLPDRNNPYSFSEFLDWRDRIDYYADDPFAGQVLRRFTGDSFARFDGEARAISRKASFRWRDMAETISWPERRPFMQHYDGHGNRIDRIVRPAETETMEREIFSEALFSERTHPMTKLIKMFLIYQNGEACVACPLTCTEGLVELLRKYADTPETRSILAHCAEGNDGQFAIGAQYLSEIQGGSDVPSNLLEAVQEDGGWRLYGKKFFCSATHADYAVVTAKPAGSQKVALFVVPSWLPGMKRREIRNGYTIDRIKWKMGTSELTTAELTFNGALGYPVGPLDRGLANVVGIVLTYSRLTVGLSAAASMSRVVREASGYARFRKAFGMSVGQFPLLAGQLRSIERTAQRTTAGAFRLYSEFLASRKDEEADSPDSRMQRFMVRELVMLQKLVSSSDCTDVIRTAMSVFGGHGVMEDFSSLPRLYRDSAVNELWEGPRNVLLTQIHRDFQKALPWLQPVDFVHGILPGHDASAVKELAGRFDTLIGHADILGFSEENIRVCEEWDALCADLFHAYQECALAMVQSQA